MTCEDFESEGRQAMKPRHEQLQIAHDSTFKCFLRRQEAFDFCWHFHREYELTLITRGTGTRYVGTAVEPYRPGDLVLLGPDLPHTFTSEPEPEHLAEASVTQFREDFLGAGFFALPQFREVAALLDVSLRGLRFSPAPQPAQEILAALPTAETAAAQTVLLLEVLHLLSRCQREQITGPGYTAAPDTSVRQRIDTVCRHLEQVHTQHVELAGIAGLVHMAPTSFSRFFQRAMGRTLTEYVNQLRVETACRLLTTTDSPITAVAARSGFANLSNFNRRFRELRSMTPREYRDAHPRP
jgi:AraC-like DNA-binding protein